MLSLFVAFFSTSFLYKSRIQGMVEGSLITNAQKIIGNYQATPAAEIVPFMQNFSGLSGNLLQLYNKRGEPLLKEPTGILNVSPNLLKRALAGETVSNIAEEDGMVPYLPVVGVPFEVDGQPYALFLSVEPNQVEMEIMDSIHLMYIIILFFGSLLIVVAARYIVKPIARLTDATKRMAKGQFDLELPTSRKDEIGILTASFNKMAKELSKLDRMRKEFVSSVSHEIQTPLTSISGFSKAIRQKKMSEESRNRYLTIIEEESERLSRLSQNLLRLTYLQQHDQPVQVSLFRLDEQLRKVVIALEPQWSAKEIEITMQLEPLTIEADEDQLKQVWTNLLGNSIKFTPEYGNITIEAQKQEQHTVISITDTGIGIPAEECADIFKPFHKVDKARDGAVKGNGLGLSIVKHIVDIHHGEIIVSGEPGVGSTFTVHLPG